MKELLLKEKELELEKQKVTIKETLQTGSSIELTCYYDQNAHQKISELLTGAKLLSNCILFKLSKRRVNLKTVPEARS